jgi:WD repeat-containing protein 89
MNLPILTIILFFFQIRLVNLFNLSASLEEDDSIYQIIKSDSVSRIGFFGPSSEYIYVTSHIETFSLYTFENADKIKAFGDIRTACEGMSVEYLVDALYDENEGRLYLVTGSQRCVIPDMYFVFQ